jgi:hypothetical protein
MESNIDPALSEAEAVWMFSDSDEDETGESDNGSVGHQQKVIWFGLQCVLTRCH